MRDVVFEHRQYGTQHSANGDRVDTVGVFVRWKHEIVTEEFVRTVEQIDSQGNGRR
ncbi:MAG TPA: hypothetical protein VIP09_12415 [Dehalococcoidia bacterium]|jgi:hypothetical protein